MSEGRKEGERGDSLSVQTWNFTEGQALGWGSLQQNKGQAIADALADAGLEPACGGDHTEVKQS